MVWDVLPDWELLDRGEHAFQQLDVRHGHGRAGFHDRRAFRGLGGGHACDADWPTPLAQDVAILHRKYGVWALILHLSPRACLVLRLVRTRSIGKEQAVPSSLVKLSAVFYRDAGY